MQPRLSYAAARPTDCVAMLNALTFVLLALPVFPEVVIAVMLFWAERQASRAGMVRAPLAPWRVVLEGQSLTIFEPTRAPVRLLLADIRAARDVAWDGFEVPRGWSDTLVLDLTGPNSHTVKIPLRDLLFQHAVGLPYRNASSDRVVGDGFRLLDAVRAHGVAVETVLLDSPVDGWV